MVYRASNRAGFLEMLFSKNVSSVLHAFLRRGRRNGDHRRLQYGIPNEG